MPGMNLATAQSAAARHGLAPEHAPKVLASAEGMVAKGLYRPDEAIERAADGWAKRIASGRPYVSRAEAPRTFMDAHILADTDGMSRDEWLAWRVYSGPDSPHGGIGGSQAVYVAFPDVAPKWSSPVQTWAKLTGAVDHDDPGEAATIGIALESTVAQLAAERLGCTWRDVPHILAHPEHGRNRANIDGVLVGVRGPGSLDGLEVKTTGGHNGDALHRLAEDPGDPWRPGIPTTSVFGWWCQCQWYMHVTGAERWFLAALVGGFGGLTVKLLDIPRCDETIDAMCQAALGFWRHHVETGEPPPVRYVDHDALAALWAVDKGIEVMGTEQGDEDLVAEWRAAKAAHAEAERAKQRADARMKDRMREAWKFHVPAGTVTWSRSDGRDRGLRWKAAKGA